MSVEKWPIVVVHLDLLMCVCFLRDGGEDGHDPAGRGDHIQGSRGLPEDRERDHQAHRLRWFLQRYSELGWCWPSELRLTACVVQMPHPGVDVTKADLLMFSSQRLRLQDLQCPGCVGAAIPRHRSGSPSGPQGGGRRGWRPGQKELTFE